MNVKNLKVVDQTTIRVSLDMLLHIKGGWKPAILAKEIEEILTHWLLATNNEPVNLWVNTAMGPLLIDITFDTYLYEKVSKLLVRMNEQAKAEQAKAEHIS